MSIWKVSSFTLLMNYPNLSSKWNHSNFKYTILNFVLESNDYAYKFAKNKLFYLLEDEEVLERVYRSIDDVDL